MIWLGNLLKSGFRDEALGTTGSHLGQINAVPNLLPTLKGLRWVKATQVFCSQPLFSIPNHERRTTL
jgi:hypothetical protein